MKDGILASMNIHPALVHFPIALLTVYAVLELARFRFFVGRPYWFHLKAAFLLLGLAGALLARQTGEFVAEQIDRNAPVFAIIEKHALFANLTGLIFGVLGLAYFMVLFEREAWLPNIRAKFPRVVGFANEFLASPVAPLVALAGLLAVTITGALGGAMVYGPNTDPVVSFVYQLLIGQ